MYGFLVDSTTTRLTFSGVEYEVEADSLRPVSVMKWMPSPQSC